MRLLLACLALATAQAAFACSLCGEGFRSSPTFRQEAAKRGAKVILHGTIASSRLIGDKGGESDFDIKGVLRHDDAIKGKARLTLPRYLPVEDRESPPQYLLFCDVGKEGIDPYRGVPVRGPRTVEYFKKALALDPKEPAKNLAFFFDYLDDSDPEVARDAFLEFARASDDVVIQAAPKFDRARLRKWLDDPKTHKGHLGLYAMLLGACGKAEDGAYLRKRIDSKEERYQEAADGLLAGYVCIDPKAGWELLHSILADGKQPLSLRLKALGSLRFFTLARPKESRPEIVKALRSVLVQGDLADFAIEDLRIHKIWDLTDDVLGCWGKKGYESPLLKRAILRYAISCERKEKAREFLAARRKEDPEALADIEEWLRFEAGK
jgi:hypothetical protein